MMLIEGFLSKPQLDELNDALSRVAFIPGHKSGGLAGALVKANLQADPHDANYPRARDLIGQAVQASIALNRYALPSRMTPINFARYGAGMAYGDHVDEPIHMLPNMMVRTDISFTIFLSGPGEYEGGELVVTTMGAEKIVKGNAGDMFAYPTGVTHRVNPIRSGTRNVAVGWIQSLVANHEHRELLYKLTIARGQLLQSTGRSPTYELVNSVRQNLLRLFAQP